MFLKSASQNIWGNNLMLIKYTCFEDFICQYNG